MPRTVGYDAAMPVSESTTYAPLQAFWMLEFILKRIPGFLAADGVAAGEARESEGELVGRLSQHSHAAPMGFWTGIARLHS